MSIIVAGFDLYCPYCGDTGFVSTEQAAAAWCEAHEFCEILAVDG